ncbi:cathelicidin antimicrobial peptide-like protein [Camelus ferus]|nr:cathelicidin antimicrobial peptide-like protein [Camelus ferus]
METQRASLSTCRWSLWLLLLGLAVPWASAQALSYREAVLRAVDRLNEQSSDPNLYRLLELDLPPKADEDPDAPKPVSFTVKETVMPRRTQLPPEQCDFKEKGDEDPDAPKPVSFTVKETVCPRRTQLPPEQCDFKEKGDEDPDAPKPVSFTVKETVCPRRTQQPPEQCDFKENGVVKQCVGTVTLDQSRDQQDITCDEEHSPATAAKAKGATSIYPTKDTKASIAATKVSYSKVSERTVNGSLITVP